MEKWPTCGTFLLHLIYVEWPGKDGQGRRRTLPTDFKLDCGALSLWFIQAKQFCITKGHRAHGPLTTDQKAQQSAGHWSPHGILRGEMREKHRKMRGKCGAGKQNYAVGHKGRKESEKWAANGAKLPNKGPSSTIDVAAKRPSRERGGRPLRGRGTGLCAQGLHFTYITDAYAYTRPTSNWTDPQSRQHFSAPAKIQRTLSGHSFVLGNGQKNAGKVEKQGAVMVVA